MTENCSKCLGRAQVLYVCVYTGVCVRVCVHTCIEKNFTTAGMRP